MEHKSCVPKMQNLAWFAKGTDVVPGFSLSYTHPSQHLNSPGKLYKIWKHQISCIKIKFPWGYRNLGLHGENPVSPPTSEKSRQNLAVWHVDTWPAMCCLSAGMSSDKARWGFSPVWWNVCGMGREAAGRSWGQTARSLKGSLLNYWLCFGIPRIETESFVWSLRQTTFL